MMIQDSEADLLILRSADPTAHFKGLMHRNF